MKWVHLASGSRNSRGKYRMARIGFTGSLVHSAWDAFLLLLLATGTLQDADQWVKYSTQMTAHIILLATAGSIGTLAGSLGFWVPKSMKLGKPWGSAIGFFVSGVLTIVSVPFGWGYWIDLNVWLFLVLTFSIAYFVFYTSLAGMLIMRRPK